MEVLQKDQHFMHPWAAAIRATAMRSEAVYNFIEAPSLKEYQIPALHNYFFFLKIPYTKDLYFPLHIFSISAGKAKLEKPY